MGYIQSNRVQGKFGFHGRLSPRFSFTGCLCSQERTCTGTYHVTCTWTHQTGWREAIKIPLGNPIHRRKKFFDGPVCNKSTMIGIFYCLLITDIAQLAARLPIAFIIHGPWWNPSWQSIKAVKNYLKEQRIQFTPRKITAAPLNNVLYLRRDFIKV